MPGIICRFCGADVGRGVDRLTCHLKYIHSFILGHKRGFTCGQEGCDLYFEFYSSLKRHLKTRHVHLAEENNEEDGDVENDDINVSGDSEGGQQDQDDRNDIDVNEYSDQEQWEGEGEDLGHYREIPGLVKLAADVIMDLHSNSAVTASVLSRVFDSLGSLFNGLIDNLKKEEVVSVVRERNTDQETSSALLGKFNVKNPFVGIDSVDKQMSLLKQHVKFVEPVQISVGEHMDMAKDRESGEYIPKLVRDTVQYIPILQVIELVLSNNYIRNAIFSEQERSDGFMHKFRDGEHFKNHPLFCQDGHAIQLQVYYDDLEVVNPLGSRTSVHKLGAFYFTILNLPQHVNSTLGAVQLFLLCNANDLKKYSFKKILQPFLDDLKILESGITMDFGEEQFVIRGTIASACGDGLAAHDMFGLLGPQCNRFCRLCSITRAADLLAGRFHCGDYRTREEYAVQIQQLQEDPLNARLRTESGIKEECALHQSAYFHFIENFVFDPMHDIFEGIGPYEVKLVLKHYVTAGVISVDDLNGRIHSFDYGGPEIRNKPSANLSRDSLRNALTDHSLKQMWLLMRVFPFLLSDKIPEDDKYMKLILLLLRITDIVFAPRIHIGSVPLLEALIREHHNMFKQLFPEARMINKHHHVWHYPRCIQEMGPMLIHWCMRFEAKHHDLSRHGAVCCNFRNLPKTLARVCQIIQAKHWSDRTSTAWDEVRCHGGQRRRLADLAYSNELLRFELVLEDFVFVPRVTEVRGTEYVRNLFVVISTGLDNEENNPVFGLILDIVLVRSTTVALYVEVWSTVCYNESLNAYHIERCTPANTTVVLTSELVDYRPIAPWHCLRDELTYLRPKTAFFFQLY